MDQDGKEEGNGGGGSNPRDETEIVQDILNLIESVAQLGDCQRTYKKDCSGLVRGMKLLWPLLEEIRDCNEPISERCVSCLTNLKKAFLVAKKLLKVCNEGSKISLVVESKAFMMKFRTINEKLCQAVEGLPFDELGISDEMKEQAELMRMHLKPANGRTDTQDIELEMDMMVQKKLDLHTVEDLNNEAIAIRNLVKERGGLNAENIQQIIDLLNKFKQIVGMEATDLLDNPVMPKSLEKCTSLVIPHEFLCPITLEIMTDPVIIASGQKWFNSNRTCPKTRQTLAHQLVTTNYALKNLILQWCEENKFHLPKKVNCPSFESFSDHSEEICSLVRDLSSSHLEMRRKAGKKIRMLSKENSENRILIASNGGILPLVQILSHSDSKIQKHSVTALLNLSIDETNKRLIAKGGGVPAIIEVLQHGSREARENSAAALFSLSMLDENKITVGLSNGIPPLVDLLQNGTVRGKRDAAAALFNLSLNHSNKARAIDEALSILLLLLGSSNSSFILAALQFGVHEHLAEITTSGTNRAQRKANALLQLMSKTEQI
ncbi:hypothetical protein P3X46_020682 [Hevea brasiliensis]|uniref:RING-type E3 ubiquitin transferase n=1 Tax=Hevea brasiliensis TaxID=3981 RepID=A0ABQ9LGN0_HEVBR|nr:hypothetical protein P3X46_020682 [Hevea brasiliensis]